MSTSVSARWRASREDEEARRYLQERIALISRVMFVSMVGLLAALGLMYEIYPDIAPYHNGVIFAGAIAGVVALGVIWRGVIVRRTLSIHQLYGIDLLYMGATGLFFAASTTLAYDFPPASYSNLLYTSFICLVRANIVPSSGRRTLATSLIQLGPMVVAAMGLAVSGRQDPRVPGPAFVLGGMFAAAVVAALSTVSSNTIYGLRQKVNQAMQLGSYTLERKIGEGGMGSVWRASHKLLRRATAIKLLPPDMVGADTLERFEREVQEMSQLSHPNTVAVFDYGHSPEGVFYYAMEYLPGIDLQRLVTRYGPQPARRVIRILTQVCGALDEAHRRGLVHRDIKPGNIILCERGGALDVAKVVDFGLVKELTADSEGSGQVVLGTPAYLAPEAITDPARVGPAADLYALAAVGYFLLTGKHVFVGNTAMAICMQHVRAEPVPPSRVSAIAIPEDLEAAIMACLAKRPEDRPASAAALAERLRAVREPDDWPDADAARWWSELRELEGKEAVLSRAETITVTIDLDERDQVLPASGWARLAAEPLRDRSSRVH
jgi:serine/threonine-protein kinase